MFHLLKSRALAEGIATYCQGTLQLGSRWQFFLFFRQRWLLMPWLVSLGLLGAGSRNHCICLCWNLVSSSFVCLQIRDTWHHLYRHHFLSRSLRVAQECKKGFYYYQQGFAETGVRPTLVQYGTSFVFFFHHSGISDRSVSCFLLQLDCSDVVLFWRIQRMLQVTSNALRQQVMNNEGWRHQKLLCNLNLVLSQSQCLNNSICNIS